jgi:hypothetical protein
MDYEKMSDERLIPLYDNVYAVRFPYAIVTEMTLSMAIPHTFRRDLRNQTIKFALEDQSTAGTKRADCTEIRKCFPAEVALLESRGVDLSMYVIFKLANG